jgi:xanthine dehydrogenase accessory factor
MLVTVRATRGSVPRESGTWMAVFAQGQVGTIGGGNLEWDVLRQARSYLQLPSQAGLGWTNDVVLGPSLGQCCGGALSLDFEPVTVADANTLRERLHEAAQPVALFGGGHVGQAIVQALAPLPFDATWIDSRDEVFPAALALLARTEHSEPVHAAVNDLPAGALVLIMSFSHAEDLDIVAACLQRQRERADLPFVGLIGSHTKWASFRSRLQARGFSDAELAHVTSPIGLPGIRGKAPAVIAAAVVAQLLQVQSQTALTR